MSGSAISLPDRQVSDSVGNYALDIILVFFLAFQFFAKNTKGGTVWVCGVGGRGDDWYSKFRRPGVEEGGLALFGPIWTDRKMGEVGCKNWTFFLDVINVWSLTYLFL